MEAYYRPWGFQEVQAPRFPGIQYMKVVMLSAKRAGRLYPQQILLVQLSWNLVAHGDAREGKWRGNRRIEWVASTLALYLGTWSIQLY